MVANRSLSFSQGHVCSKVHILGAGALGRLFASRMVSAGVPTTLIMRAPNSNAETVSLQNVWQGQANSQDARPHIEVHRISCETSSQIDSIQVLLVATKAHAAVTAIQGVSHRLSRDRCSPI